MGSLLLLGVGGGGAPSIPAAFYGAQIEKSADQNTADYTTATAISWAQAQFDTSSFFSAGSPTKLTVPSALNGYYGVIVANVSVTNIGAANNSVSLHIQKGGSLNYVGAAGFKRARQSIFDSIQCRTQPILLSTGDEFTAVLKLHGDNSVTVVAASSSFGIYIVGASVPGALVYDASGTTGQNYNFTNINTWDTAAYDSLGFFSGGAPSKLTVPAGANGRYGIVKGNILLSSVSATQDFSLQVIRGGVGVPGFSGIGTQVTRSGSSDTDGLHWCEVETQPILLSTGDEFELNVKCSDTSVDMSQYSSFGIELMPTSFRGVLAKMNADQAAANYNAGAPFPFDGADIYDTDGSHDPASNNTKIIVPSALNGKKAMLLSNMYSSNLTTNSSGAIGIRRGGSTTYPGFGGHSGDTGSFTNNWIQARSQIVTLTTGQEFTAHHSNTDTSITVEQEGTTFGLRLLPEI